MLLASMTVMFRMESNEEVLEKLEVFVADVGKPQKLV